MKPIFPSDDDKAAFHATVRKYGFRFFAMFALFLTAVAALSIFSGLIPFGDPGLYGSFSIIFLVLFLVLGIAWAIAYNKVCSNGRNSRLILLGAFYSSILFFIPIVIMFYGVDRRDELSVSHAVELGSAFVFSYLAGLMNVGWWILLMRFFGIPPYWFWVDAEDMYTGRDLTDRDA